MRDLWLRDGVAFKTVLGEEEGGAGSGGRRAFQAPAQNRDMCLSCEVDK